MIVVTGAAGFIGSNVVAGFNEIGVVDIVACDFLGTESKWLNLRKRALRDVVPPNELFQWLEARNDIELIVHMGANSSTLASDGDEIMRSNYRFSLKTLDWCTKTQTPLIYASSAATYGDGTLGFDDDWSVTALRRLRPLNLYGWSKHLFDQEVAIRYERNDRLPPACVGLKFFNVYGPNEYHKGSMMSVLAKSYGPALAGETIELFKSYRSGTADGAQKRDFVYVTDIVDVVLWFARRASDVGIYNIGSGLARSFNDLITGMFDAMGLDLRIKFIDMPTELRPRYQYFTQATLTRLRSVGYLREFSSLEFGVSDFVKQYLAKEDRFR